MLWSTCHTEPSLPALQEDVSQLLSFYAGATCLFPVEEQTGTDKSIIYNPELMPATTPAPCCGLSASSLGTSHEDLVRKGRLVVDQSLDGWRNEFRLMATSASGAEIIFVCVSMPDHFVRVSTD